MIYLKLAAPYLRYLPIALFAGWVLLLIVLDMTEALWDEVSLFDADDQFELSETVADGDCRTVDGIKICGGSYE